MLVPTICVAEQPFARCISPTHALVPRPPCYCTAFATRLWRERTAFRPYRLLSQQRPEPGVAGGNIDIATSVAGRSHRRLENSVARSSIFPTQRQFAYGSAVDSAATGERASTCRVRATHVGSAASCPRSVRPSSPPRLCRPGAPPRMGAAPQGWTSV